MEENAKILSLKLALSTIIVLAVISAALIFLFSFLNSKRQQSISHKYQSETAIYISKNTSGLKELFTKVIPDEADTCIVGTPVIEGSKLNDCSTESGQRRNKISRLVGNNLKDFSSTMFVKLNSHQEILVMRLSGDVRPLNIYPPEKEVLVRQLLEGQIAAIPWDRYSTELPTKEIYIPVFDETGKILGAIVRGIIE